VIPIRDRNPSLRFPAVTLALIAANVAVFLFQLSLSIPETAVFVHRYGVIPAVVQQLVREGPGSFHVEIQLGRQIAIFPLEIDWSRALVSFFAGMFLHGGLLHLVGNLWILWIFGDNVEDRLGRLRYLVFYLLSGLAASAIHVATNFDSRIPTIGASGAIAGVLGAYLVMFPRARILALVPLFFVFTWIEVPAFVFLGLWFLLQLVSAAGPQEGAGGVAWWAHVGGFAFGVLLLFVFRRRRR
jgi:membrane associated rhomboid family serine protease